MAKVAFGRLHTDKEGRHSFYAPGRVADDPSWPFRKYDIVNVRIEDGKVVYEKMPEGINPTIVTPYKERKLLTRIAQTLLQRGN